MLEPIDSVNKMSLLSHHSFSVPNNSIDKLILLLKFECRILPNTRASPNRPPPPEFLDHLPEVSRPDLPINAV